MGRPVLMNMLAVHSDYHTASSRTRHYRRTVDSEVASADAMEGLPIADHGTNIPSIPNSDRPQQDATSSESSSASRTRADRLKDSLGFRLMLFRRTVKEALATSKPPTLPKEALSPTARDLEDSYSCLRDMSAVETSLAKPQRDSSQHAPGQGSNPSASSSRGIGFKKTWKACETFLMKVAKEAVGWSKLSEPAGEYFDHIAGMIEGYNIRLRSWATYELEILDPGFGDSSPSKLMDYLTNILEEIMASGEEIRKEVEFLGSLASQGLVEQSRREIGIQGSLAGQKSVEEIEEEMKTVGSLAGQQVPRDLGLDLTRKLQTSTSRIDTESKKIALAVLTLVRLREAVLMHQATVYQNGPLAGRREEMLRILSEVEARTRPQEHHAETERGEPTIHLPK